VSYSQLILKDYADIVWPLDDVSSTASLSAPVNFFHVNTGSYSASVNLDAVSIQGIPMIYGGGSLLQFTSSAVGLSLPALGRFSDLYRDKNSVMSFWIKIDRVDTQEQPIFKKRGEDNVGLFIKNDYLIFKFGNSASASKIVGVVPELNEPHYVVVGAGPGYRSLMIDGVEYKDNSPFETYPHSSSSIFINDVIDFYGPRNGFWEIDSPAFFPNLISSTTAKRHYVYGLGKWVDDSVFFSRGGNIYNFTTIETERLYEAAWDYPEEWQLSFFKDLEADDTGIKPLSFTEPELWSFDSNITKENDSIKFASSSLTYTSYIDILNVSNKILDGSYPFFAKFKLDGTLPVEELSQRLISYGVIPYSEMINIDLFNDSGQYKVKLSSTTSTASLSFDVQGISSSPDIYVGLKFDGNTTFYFAQSGSAIQSASFSYLSASGSGLDPLYEHFPPKTDTSIRIAGSLIYDLKNSTPLQPFDFNQFRGTFNKFIVVQPEDISSLSQFDDIDSYRKIRYGFTHNSDENRFLVKSYGGGSFNIHSSEIGEIRDDESIIIGSNLIEVGYPDITSASNVIFNVTHYAYTGSVQNATQRLDKKTYLGYLNNIDIASTFLKFDFEIYASDLIEYPPKIKYFHMETYKSNNGKTVLRDDAGVPYFLYPNTSSVVYLPETRLTPTIFLRDNSGLKLNESIVDFSEKIYPVPLDPRDITGLVLWLDARHPLGLRRTKYLDDERVNRWIDLSGNEFHAIQSASSSQPVYRNQSLNLFTIAQLTGSEPGNLNNIFGVSASILSSTFGVVRGSNSIEVRPNGTSIDSYLDLGYNSASITVFPNTDYTVVGTMTLSKRQTASALHPYARSIVIYNSDGTTASVSGISSKADNLAGTYSLSATFSTDSTTTQALIRYYNGSYSPDDPVYWDNLGLYPVSSSIAYGSGGSASVAMPISSWAIPLTEANDHPVMKFDGIQTFMETAASVSQPYTMFIVGRAFNDGVFVGYSASGASLYTYDGNYYISSGSAQVQVPSTSDYNVYTIEVNSGSAKFYLNGEGWYLRETGYDDINGLLLGKGTLLDNSENYLAGDLAAVVLYAGEFDYQTRSAVESWLDESFNLLSPVIGVTPLNDRYLEEYTFRYPTSP
jgi:hypothetical protein